MSRATGPRYIVPFKRRRSNLTNYRARLKLLKSMKPRLVVRKSLKHVLVQFINYSNSGDVTLVSINSKQLARYGWSDRRNTPTAYLTGLLAGLMAKKKGVKEFTLDVGLQTPSKGSIVFAALKGAVDAGLKANCDENMIDIARIKGEHIQRYAKSLKEKGDEKKFSNYLKAGIQPANISTLFENTKQAILKELGG